MVNKETSTLPIELDLGFEVELNSVILYNWVLTPTFEPSYKLGFKNSSSDNFAGPPDSVDFKISLNQKSEKNKSRDRI